jgi:hypothetical protein
VLILRESFARRAYRKTGEICCAECGSQLGNSVNCPSCGALYPDYIVADTPDAVRKRKRASTKWEPFKGLEFSLRPSRRGDESTYVPQYVAAGTTDGAPAGSRNLVVGLVALVIGIALLAGGVGAYNHHQKTKRYAATFVATLYAIKSGVELSTDVSMKVTGEWKKKEDAGLPYQPRPAVDDEARLNRLKGEVDRLMQKMQPPAKFAAVNEQLVRLNGMYGRAHALALAPAGSRAEFRESATKLQGDFMKAARELKGALPPRLAEEFKKGQARYIGLRDL